MFGPLGSGLDSARGAPPAGDRRAKEQGDGEGEGFVAMTLLNAEEPDGPIGKQPLHRGLNVGAHVAGKLSRR